LRIIVYHHALDYVFRFGGNKNIGGGEVLAYYLLNQLASEGHEVVLLTHQHDKALFPLPEVRVRTIPIPVASPAMRAMRCTVASKAVIGLGSYDACLILHPLTPFGLALALRFPSVWYHIEPIVKVSERHFEPQPLIGLAWTPGIAFAHIVRRVLTLSAYMSRLVDSHYLRVNSKPVYAGIPADKFQAATVEDTKVVTFVGRINDQKNVFRLLRAFKLCTDTIPEARLKVIARGPATVEEEFVREIKTLGLGDKVLWDRESVVSSSTRNHYHDAQVVAYPSLHEAFGLVVVEAMASGRPVITSNFGGPAEIVSNNREGLLVNPYNEAEIAAAIVRLLSDIGLCREMGRRARSKFEQNFTIERIARSIESHLKTCASS